jgi:hypothetical protein
MTFPYTAGRAELAGRFLVPGTSQGIATEVECDSGSDVSAIDQSLAQALGAVPAGTATLTAADGTQFQAAIYSLDLDLGPAGVVRGWRFYALPGSPAGRGGVGGLVGQDLLTRGQFAELPDGFVLQVGSAAPPAPSAPLADAVAVVAVLALLATVGIGLAVGG